jgi:hypothetical protein
LELFTPCRHRLEQRRVYAHPGPEKKDANNFAIAIDDSRVERAHGLRYHQVGDLAHLPRQPKGPDGHVACSTRQESDDGCGPIRPRSADDHASDAVQRAIATNRDHNLGIQNRAFKVGIGAGYRERNRNRDAARSQFA